MDHAAATLAVDHLLMGRPEDASVRPVAPPDLVRRFESMMQQAAPAGETPAASAHVPTAAIAGVDRYLGEATDLFSQMTSVDPRSMSLSESMAFTVQMMGRAAAMSIKNESCFSVVNSAKKSVTDLMKSQ